MNQIPLKAYVQLLGEYLRPLRRQVMLLALCLLGGTALQLLVPQVMRYVIDASMAEGVSAGVIWMVVLFFGLALLEQGVATSATYLGENIAWKATNQMRSSLTRHALRLDLSFHGARTPGELIERVDGDVGSLANFFSTFVIQVGGSALLIVGVLVAMFLQDWRAGLTVAVYVAVSLLILDRIRNKAIPHWVASRQADAELYGFIEERIAGAHAIRTSGATGYVLNRFYQLTRAAWQKTLKAALMATAMVNIAWIIFAVGNALAMVVAAVLYQRGELSIGAAYLMVHYTMLISRPIDIIIRQMEEVQRAGAGIGRIQELQALKTKVPDGPGVLLPGGALGVDFENVSFGYAEDRPVLHGLSFRLKPGTVLGLLGRTGSGKTTITRLVARLYNPDSGTVRLGAANIRAARQDELSAHVSMVTQRVHLFHASLRENLTFFDQSVPDERIVAALEELGLGPWFRSLPEGLDTKLAPGGGGLSAGEGQLLAFTRVLLRDPGIIILDEPTSRLDPATEQVVQRAVGRLLRGRTAIVIAHRLATVQQVDEIMILDQGQIKEHGPREALAKDSGSHFHRLLQTGIEELIA